MVVGVGHEDVLALLVDRHPARVEELAGAGTLGAEGADKGPVIGAPHVHPVVGVVGRDDVARGMIHRHAPRLP
jgi:hypothetical protein